ncbi:hypothetical protein GGI42DRAFT_358121 [Trichoderma sp. SZMC 28013]
MESKLEADQYFTPEEFIRDAKLIFNNSRRYNPENTPYAKSASKLGKYMWKQIKGCTQVVVPRALGELCAVAGLGRHGICTIRPKVPTLGSKDAINKGPYAIDTHSR